MVSTAIYITVPLLLEALSKHLNEPYEKLKEYYDTSKAFRDYITSLTTDFELDIRDKIATTTPSTTPRFDVPWILQELKKKQQEIFNIKKELAANEIEIERTQRAEYLEPPKPGKIYNPKLEGEHGKRALSKQQMKRLEQLQKDNFRKKHGYLNKEEFLKKKAEDTRKGNLKTIELNQKLQQINDRPLVNRDPRYKSYYERIHNAQQKKTNEE